MTAARQSPDVLADNVFMLEGRPRDVDLRRALQLVATLPATPKEAGTNAVLTNIVGVIAHGRPHDFERTAALGAHFGHQFVADRQSELDGRLGKGPNVPFATAGIIKLSRTHQIESALLSAGRPTTVAHRIATGCANAAFWLLMADIDPRHPAPIPTTPNDLLMTVERRGADVWRQILANIAVHPWGTPAVGLAELARTAGLEIPAQAIERCATVYRHRTADSERADVAKEIRRLVAISGCSQRQFAQYLGTSAPRLSTYVSGRVTPSATMMLRIKTQSAALAEDRAFRMS